MCNVQNNLIALQVGSGTQIVATFLVTLVLASAGFLSPASRGALLTSAVVLFLLLAITSGFTAVLLWINTTHSYEGWTSICLKTACYFPGALRTLSLCSCFEQLSFFVQ
jgi:transmembrane 9 superfamily member 2/4